MDKISKQFTPVTPTGSPVSKGKALTGVPHNVRELVKEVHTNIQNWNVHHLKGIPIVQSIVDLKTDESYPDGLNDLCSSLEKICIGIDEIVDNFQSSLDKLEKLQSLDKDGKILFSTWTIANFVTTVKSVYTSYKEEAKLKRTVLENIAHEYEDVAKTVNSATWVYQPAIPDNLKFQVEMMLIETGLREI